MERAQKIKEVAGLQERFEKAKAMIFAEYRGLRVGQMTDLRHKLRATGSSIKVVKNRLVKRVLADRGMNELSAFFVNPTAIATNDTDPVAPAKILVEFARANAALLIKAGFMDGAMLTRAQIEMLAMLPSKDVLLARALASMNAPATNFVGVLAAVPRALVTVIDALRKKKESNN